MDIVNINADAIDVLEFDEMINDINRVSAYDKFFDLFIGYHCNDPDILCD
jgi:hypothetical protein